MLMTNKGVCHDQVYDIIPAFAHKQYFINEMKEEEVSVLKNPVAQNQATHLIVDILGIRLFNKRRP